VSASAERDNVLVCTQGELAHLPAGSVLAGCEIRELDLHHPPDVNVWLTVHNASFGNQWTERELVAAVLEHDHIRVTRTFLASFNDVPSAVASIGRFRRNDQIGVGHYLGVVPECQGIGLGRALAIHRYAALRDEGVRIAESQTHIGRVRSLRLHFDLGFRPKWGLDAWNNTDRWSTSTRLMTNARLQLLYRRWRRSNRT
jgi:GNAT superfamily N-acetyltransferase